MVYCLRWLPYIAQGVVGSILTQDNSLILKHMSWVYVFIVFVTYMFLKSSATQSSLLLDLPYLPNLASIGIRITYFVGFYSYQG